MAVADVSAEDRQRRELRVGVVVSAIEAGGPAADAGIKKDDVILELGGRGLSSAADYGALRRTQAPGDRFLLCRVLRGREVFYTAIEN
jgi:S1-C subfamily serine protease